MLAYIPFKTSDTLKKWKIKILISENCNFFEIKKRGGQKTKISYFMIFSHYLDSFWPRNEFIGHFNEIYCKTWWKPISLFFLGHTVYIYIYIYICLLRPELQQSLHWNKKLFKIDISTDWPFSIFWNKKVQIKINHFKYIATYKHTNS